MSDTKICPFCGKEILTEAKKCRFCGKSLEKKCPVCGEWINIDAKKCRHCGAWLSESARRMYGDAPARPVEKKNTVSSAEDWKSRILLYLEAGVAIGLLWFIYDWTWWTAVLALFISIALLSFTVFRIIFCIGVSVVWAILAMVLCPALFDGVSLEAYTFLPESVFWDYWWVGLIMLLMAIGWHLPAFRNDFEL